MGNLKINFQLQELNKIMPFGEKPHLSLHWFGLTDGLLWINVGTQTIYEYSEDALKHFKHKQKYNDYYIARFLEDFFDTFKFISKSIPKELYTNIEQFDYHTEKWLDSQKDEQEEMLACYYEVCKWRCDRSFDSGHLVGGPYIGCFRCDDKIKILWKTEFKLDNGKNIWTAQNGIYELPYIEFVLSIKEFFESFCSAMNKQVENALNKKWGKIFLDKELLLKENSERKLGFLRNLSLLDDVDNVTNWDNIMTLYSKIKEHISKNTK